MFAERVPHGIIQSGNIDFVLNAPHYRHNGHSLGDGVEMETPDSRYSDERIEADVAAPNTLLNAAL